jgi:teichuronic acid biosynthesis glycosyltransferase TuaH
MKIVYLSAIAYDDLKQRPQYMAEKLSEKNEVIYIEPTIRWISCVLGRAKEYKRYVRKISASLTVVRCNGLFVLPFRWKPYDFMKLGNIAERVQLKKYLSAADVIIVGYEGWTDVVQSVKSAKIVYDKMDDNVLLTNEISLKKYLKKMERRLLKKTDYMVVTAQRFFDKYQDNVKNISLIPNAVDVKTVAIKQRKDHNESSHVFGYVGMISEWFDFRALEVIAEQENITVDLVGPCNVAKYNKENVVYEGKIPKDMVGQKIQSFDVCLYPFKNGKLLDTVNPVKIYEYLAENKPVIAVDSVETRKFGNLIYRYRDYEELRKLCNTQLRKPFQTDEECMKYIENNSWEKRMRQFEKTLEEIV